MRANRIFYILLTLCVIIFGASTLYRAAWDSVQRTDYTVYTAAGQAILDHQDIYLAQNARGWRYVYPPPFAILMVPLSQIPLALGALIWYLISVLSIGASVMMSAALLDNTRLKNKAYLVYGLPLLSLSVLLVSGAMRCQASPFMFCFMIATFYLHLKQRPVFAGLSLACAAMLKVFPIVLIAYFIIQRQWRTVIATGVGLILLGIVLPSLYWGWQFNFDQILRWLDVVGHPAMMHNSDRAQMTSLYAQLLDTTKPRNQSLESLFLSVDMPAYLTHYAVGAAAMLMLGVMWVTARSLQLPVDRSIGLGEINLSPLQKNLPTDTQSSQERASTVRIEDALLCSAFLIWSLLITPIAETHYFGALLLPLTMLIGYVAQSQQTHQHKVRFIASGGIIMSVVMILITIDPVAIWRPLCMVSILLWLLCIHLIWLRQGDRSMASRLSIALPTISKPIDHNA